MNMLKKLMMGALVAFAFSQNAMALSEISGVYQIGACQDLHEFSTFVNAGNYTANAVLTANINMAECKDGASTRAFTPIGDYGSNTSKKYKGTFDGKGFTITGIIIVGEDDQFYGGLVGYLDASGVVEDVVLYDINMSSPTGSGNFDYIGGIAGYSLGNIRNCTVAGASTIFARRTIGGIVGLAEGGTIINCLSNVKLLAYAATDERTYAGGIVGRATNAVTIKNSVYVGSQIMRCNLNKVSACGDLNKRDECQTTCAVEKYDLVHECAIACGDELNNPHTYPNIENCYVDGEALKSKNHTIDGAPNNTSGETVNGVTELTAAEINTDSTVCKLNGGTWHPATNVCIGGDGPWTTGESVTNHGGVNLGDETYFNIIFDANGGKFTDNSTKKTKNIIAYGTIDTIGVTPMREGDVFLGWGSSDVSTSKVTLGQATAATTFYAIWANSYLIKFDANGGKFPNNAITTKRVAKNSEIDAVGITSPYVTSGLIFVGWSQNQSAKKADANLGNANEAKVFYAVYTAEFTISFNSNGHGTFEYGANRTKNVSIGDAITTVGIDNPIPDVGYTFLGWSRSAAATVPDENLGVMETSPINVFAVWQEKKVTITFDPNGGYFDDNTLSTIAKTKSVRIGDKINSNSISTTNPPVKSLNINSEFLGWNTNQNATEALADLGNASESVTFYAIFTGENIYTVTFHDNGYGSLPENQRVLETSGEVTKPADLTEKGYTFGGWFTEQECVTEFNFATIINQNMDLYAKWTPNTHKVTINVYDDKNVLMGTESDVLSGNVGSAITLPSKEEMGYAYSPWQTESDGVVIIDNKFIMPDNDVVIASVKTPLKFELAWELGGGVITSTLGTYTDGDVSFGAQIVSPTVARVGYEFEGWTLDGDNKVIDFPTMPTNRLEYFAIWSVKSHAITYKLFGANYDLEGTTHESPLTLEFGTVISEKTAPASIPNYNFSGWVWKNATTKEIIAKPSRMPDFDIVVEGRYTPIMYNVTFDGNGRSISIPVQQVAYNALVVKPDDLISAGFSVEGWYKEQTCKNKWNFETDKITGNRTLYAKWDIAPIVTAYDGIFDNQPHNIDVIGPTGSTVKYSDNLNGTYNTSYGKTNVGKYTVYYKVSLKKYSDVTGSSTITISPVVQVSLPPSAKLKCEVGDIGAEFCNATEDGIIHKYGVETILPEVTMDGWNFDGWFSDNIEFKTQVTSIAANQIDPVNLYPKFTKEIPVTLSAEPSTINVLVDNNDTPDSVSNKVNEAFNNFNPKPENPTKESSDKYDYTFKEFVCEENPPTYSCEAVFDSIGRTFTIAVNLPEGASLKCEASDVGAENCTTDKKAIEHQYTKETTPLPNAEMKNWDFIGWFDDKNGKGNSVISIEKEAYGDNIKIYPYFTKDVEIVLSEEPKVDVNIILDMDDTPDSVSNKVNEAFNNLNPKPENPTKESSDKYDYTFKEFVCEENPPTYSCEAVFDSIAYVVEIVVQYGKDDKDTIHVIVLNDDSESVIGEKIMKEFKEHDPALAIPEKKSDSLYSYEFEKFVKNSQTGHYEPKFKDSPRIYKITFHMPDEAKLLKEIKGNVYGEETILPNAAIKGSDWEFKGWFTDENGIGSRVKVIGANDLGEKEYFALFQKTIKYEVNEKIHHIEIMYTIDSTKAIAIALKGVIPNDFNKNGKTYSFSEWILTNGVYVANFAEATSIAQTRFLHFNVMLNGRTLEITGAKRGSKIAVFDLGGRLIQSEIVEQGTQLLEIQKPGNYIVRVNNQVRQVNIH